MSEHDEQVALFNILSLYEDKYPNLKWIFAIPNGGHRHIAVAKRMKSEGVKSGVWDIFVPCLMGYSYEIDWGGLFIEMKHGSNKLTDSQLSFKNDLGGAYQWAVCYSAIEAVHAIGEYLQIQELTDVV